MAARHWLDQFAIELRRQRLPAGYSARLLEELADHLSQLEQECTSMDAQLLLEERIGRPETVAAEARSEYTRRTFAGRHPVVMFGVIPVLTVMVAVIASMFAVGGVIWVVCELAPGFLEPSGGPTILHWLMVYITVYLMRLAPFLLVALLFARTGCKIHQPKWGLLACTIVAAMAFLFWMRIDTVPDSLHGRLYLGFAPLLHPDQWLQAALPLAIGLWTWWSMQRRERLVGAA